MTMVEKAQPGLLIGSAPQLGGGRDPWLLEPREIWRSVRLMWPAVVLPCVILLAAAALWTVLHPPQYAASTQLLIDPRGLQVVKDGLTPPDQATDASLLLVDSQVRVLTSDDVLGRIVERFDLAADPEFQGKEDFIGALRGAVSRLAGRVEPATDARLTALRALRERVGARRLERSFVVELGVTTADREKSARLARGVAETYLTRDATTRADTTRRAGEAIQGRLGELREALRQAEDRAQAFRAKNNIVGTRAQLVSEQQLTQLSDQLGSARARTVEASARVRQIEGVLGGPLESVSEIVLNPTISALRGQLAGVERARAEAEQTYGQRHPAYLAAQVQERSLRGAIDAEIRRIVAASRNDRKAAQANEQALAATLERRKADALKVGDDFVQLREFERQVEASRAIYESFLARARELQEQERLDTSASRIISPASPPERRLGPATPVIFLAALVSGLGLGVVGSLGLELAGGRVRSRRRLEGHIGRAVFDALPVAPRGDVGQGRADGPYEVALARLRHRLAASFPSTRPLVVLVTAADDRPGKSSLARALALSAAADWERVILVDADARGLLTREIGAKSQRGLAETLRDKRPLAEALTRLHSYLSFLPRPEGLPRTLAADLAGALVGSDADLVVVDLGLVGSDVVAEHLLSDERIQAVVLAVSAARSRLGAVDRALERLGKDRRLRLVVTAADPRD